LSVETTRRDIAARDDDRHDHAGEAGWTERASFAFLHPELGWGGIATVELDPGTERGTSSFVVFLPGGAVALSLARAKVTGRGGMVVGPLEFYTDDPLGKWGLRCRDLALVFPRAEDASLGATERTGAATRIAADLSFEATGEPAGTSLRRTETTDSFVRTYSAGAFVQPCRARGKLRLGNHEMNFEGLAVRARSWGVRDAAAARLDVSCGGASTAAAVAAAELRETVSGEAIVATAGAARANAETVASIDAEGERIALLRIDGGHGLARSPA
jgi:hypothetical protein